MRPAVPVHLQAHIVVGVACGDNHHDDACATAGGVEAQVREVPVQQGNLSRLRVPGAPSAGTYQPRGQRLAECRRSVSQGHADHSIEQRMH
jgi:hypothetical protein